MSSEHIILGLLAAALVAVAAYFVMGYLKGSITLQLRNTQLRHGQTFTGQCRLLAKKPIEGNRLFAALVARKITKERDREGKTRTRTREVYRSEHQITGPKTYPAGFDQQFDFELRVPSADDQDDSGLGDVIGAIGGLLTNRRSYIEWKVEVRLDAKGIDLSASKKVYPER